MGSSTPAIPGLAIVHVLSSLLSHLMTSIGMIWHSSFTTQSKDIGSDSFGEF